MNLGQLLTDAKKQQTALGAFNIFNSLSAEAVITAGERLNLPVILQTSVSTVKQIGVQRLSGLLQSLIDNSSTTVIFHLDHCTDPSLAKQCIDAGWNSVMFDGSALSLSDNIKLTHEIVDYAHERGCDVEGELGTIQGVEDNIHTAHAIEADYEHSLIFIEETGIDAFAPAVGTAHGQYHAAPHINYELVKQLTNDTEVPIVIHGGTGLGESVFQKLILCGASKINISTALKLGYMEAYKEYSQYYKEANPLKLDAYLEDKLMKIAIQHMSLFQEVKQNVPY